MFAHSLLYVRPWEKKNVHDWCEYSYIERHRILCGRSRITPILSSNTIENRCNWFLMKLFLFLSIIGVFSGWARRIPPTKTYDHVMAMRRGTRRFLALIHDEIRLYHVANFEHSMSNGLIQFKNFFDEESGSKQWTMFVGEGKNHNCTSYSFSRHLSASPIAMRNKNYGYRLKV